MRGALRPRPHILSTKTAPGHQRPALHPVPTASDFQLCPLLAHCNQWGVQAALESCGRFSETLSALRLLLGAGPLELASREWGCVTLSPHSSAPGTSTGQAKVPMSRTEGTRSGSCRVTGTEMLPG